MPTQYKPTGFRGSRKFLSNFFAVPISYEGRTYGSTEAAYQASKCLSRGDRVLFVGLSPEEAKYRGKRVTLRPDWEAIKLKVMDEILRIKFADPALKRKLVQTGDEELVENNWWGDTYWGVCRGKGENHLGKLLMKLREEFKHGQWNRSSPQHRA